MLSPATASSPGRLADRHDEVRPDEDQRRSLGRVGQGPGFCRVLIGPMGRQEFCSKERSPEIAGHHKKWECLESMRFCGSFFSTSKEILPTWADVCSCFSEVMWQHG